MSDTKLSSAGPVDATLIENLVAASRNLAHHGVRAEGAQFRPLEREVGRGLLAAAREFGADLLAMGAYSHSRLRQLILGGVTRHVLEHATVPVLMSR